MRLESELIAGLPDPTPAADEIRSLIRERRDWRINTESAHKSVVFMSGSAAGETISPVSGLSERGHRYAPAFYALAAGIESARRRYGEQAAQAGRPAPGTFAIIVEGVRCRVQRVQEAWFHVRVPRDLVPLAESGLLDSLRKIFMSPELDAGGLVIVCGGFGSGKTNTVNAVVRARIAARGGYAFMVGAPIEYELSGFHGPNERAGYIEQIDLVGLDL